MTGIEMDRVRAECEALGIEFRDSIEFYREWEMRVAIRAMRKLIPVVVASDDPDLERDFEVLMHVIGTHWRKAYSAEDRQIASGRRGRDTVLELQSRDELIRAEAARIAAEKGTRRGIAGFVKRRLKLDLTERQIRTIIKTEITS